MTENQSAEYLRHSGENAVTIDVGYVHVLTDDGECAETCPHPVHEQAGFKSPPVSTPHGGPQEAGEGVGFPQASDSKWDTEEGVTCVVCPDCAFTFDAAHEDNTGGGGYSCPLCNPARIGGSS